MPLLLTPQAKKKFEESKLNPSIQGYLEKRGEKRKNWKKRWCFIKDCYLFYCQNKNADLPQGIVNIHGSILEQTNILGPKGSYGFSILSIRSVSIEGKWENRKYFFSLSSIDELNEWTTAIRNAVERAREAELEKFKSSHPNLNSLEVKANPSSVQSIPSEKGNNSSNSKPYYLASWTKIRPSTAESSTSSEEEDTNPSIFEESELKSSRSEDRKGNDKDEKENDKDEKENDKDEKENDKNEKGNDVDVKGNTINEMKGNDKNEKGNDKDEKENDKDEKGNDVDVKGNTINEMKGNDKDEKENDKEVNNSDLVQNTESKTLSSIEELEIQHLKDQIDILKKEKEFSEKLRKSRTLCVICQIQDISICFMPCMHACVCKLCMNSGINQCSICDTHINSHFEILLPSIST